MQEELERKTVAILYNGGKLSARTLARLAAVLVRMAQQAYQKGLTPHGRQSVKKLMNHRTGTEAAEYVGAPRQFDRVARKFNVDYAFTRSRRKNTFCSSSRDSLTRLPPAFPNTASG